MYIPLRGEDGSKHQRVYKDGLLAYKQEISKYGTALKKETYSFLSDKRSKLHLRPLIINPKH